jgi:hypothetical protein
VRKLWWRKKFGLNGTNSIWSDNYKPKQDYYDRQPMALPPVPAKHSTAEQNELDLKAKEFEKEQEHWGCCGC